MHGVNKTICIAGTNKCAIDALNFLIRKKNKNFRLLALPDKSDSGLDGWQPSFKKFAKKNKVEITNLKKIYKIKDLYLFSLEYRNIFKIHKFNSKHLFNIHFSLLPKYRGCHTNFMQIFNGEKFSGVSLHIMDKGIDTGKIIKKIKFSIKINDTAYQNYIKLMKYAFIIFKKNFLNIINGNFKFSKQKIKKGSYYSRDSVDYKKFINIKNFKNNVDTHNQIRSLIFPPFQLPIYNGKKIIRSYYKKKKIKLIYL